jgi:hypothetical protein
LSLEVAEKSRDLGGKSPDLFAGTFKWGGDTQLLTLVGFLRHREAEDSRASIRRDAKQNDSLISRIRDSYKRSGRRSELNRGQ